jgi:transketolase
MFTPLKTKLDDRSKFLRQTIIKILDGSRRGHPGSAMSLIEIIRVLYDDILNYSSKRPKWAERDRFILSKGHGCLALYSVLSDKGFFSKSELKSYCQADSLLGGHPVGSIPGVEFATGSLGHGLPVGVGMAMAVRNLESRIWNQGRIKKNNHNSKFIIHNSNPRVFVLISDGECNEGSVWESMLAAGKYGVSNLTIIIDYDKFQSYGPSREILNLDPLQDKIKSFGLAVVEVNGHDVLALKKVFQKLPLVKNKTSVIICHTVKGKGFKSMENNPAWHHKRAITDEEIKMLFSELEGY